MPAKFDDLTKVATKVLNDDYQVRGFQFKTKHKTALDSATVTTAVDLFDKGGATGAKITWKLPSPLGLKGVSVDKLEMDKTGGVKVEAVLDERFHRLPNLKLDFKGADLNGLSTGLTLGGIKDTLVKAEFKPLAVGQTRESAVFEVTKDFSGGASAGLRLKGLSPPKPELAVCGAGGPCFMALTASDMFKSFGIFYLHKLKDLTIVTAFQRGTKKDDGISAAVAYQVRPDTSVKAKLQQDMSVSASVNHELCKGFTVLAGGRFSGKESFSFGMQVSVE